MLETVLSGIRAIGRLHFGNLLGAVGNFVRFQQTDNAIKHRLVDNIAKILEPFQEKRAEFTERKYSSEIFQFWLNLL